MPYDFDTVINRKNTASLKWDVAENELPMWVADMDFQTAPEIREVIEQRAVHGVFGYSVIPDEWYDAYTGWWKKRHGFEMDKDWLIFCTGVIPAISSIVRKITTPAEKVVIAKFFPINTQNKFAIVYAKCLRTLNPKCMQHIKYIVFRCSYRPFGRAVFEVG